MMLLLLIADLFVGYHEIVLNQRYPHSWLFYFDRRLNIPFFFSVFLSLINLILLFQVIQQKNALRQASFFWMTLFITFFLFTLDETFYIHQHFKMSTFGSIASYNQKSWTHYLWVIPYFFVFGILISILFRYASSITYDVRKKLLLAGFIFLSGAVIMEFAGTFYVVINPRFDFQLLLIKSVEGTLQMAGSIMFIKIFWTMISGYNQTK